jgi:ABC-type oligopeptide transport system ATPase subunit
MISAMGSSHILDKLDLPDRFEGLADRLGPEVVRLLVEPTEHMKSALEGAKLAVDTRREGLFLPLVGGSGAGKTTLSKNLTNFYPSSYAPTVEITGAIDYDSMNAVVRASKEKLAASDSRVVPVIIDHRESAPPSAAEMAAIKRFLRPPSVGSRCILIWPETSRETARAIAESFEVVAGKSSIPIPLAHDGPPPETWKSIATDTITLCNGVDAIAALGVDPQTYNAQDFKTLGAYLRQLSMDFNERRLAMIRSTRKRMFMAVVFVSTTKDAGVLTQLTDPRHLGLLEAKSLLASTSNSQIGKWWDARRGALTSTLFKLDARAYAIPPACAVAVLRRYAENDVIAALKSLRIGDRSVKQVVEYIGRAEFGKYLLGDVRGAYENRGAPPTDAIKAISELGKRGYTYGKDKLHNKALASAIGAFMDREFKGTATTHAEERIPLCALIPDVWVERNDDVVCLEFTWRNGDFLSSGNRSTVSQYILEKLKNYALALDWVAN